MIRASAIRERVTPWAEIGGARVGISELGQRLPSLIVEGADGKILTAYGEGLINRPLEEAAGLINEWARTPPFRQAQRESLRSLKCRYGLDSV
jgi:hypothetical protein